MKVNVDKIKVTVVSWKRDEKLRIYIDGKKSRGSQQIKIFGSLVTKDVRLA